MILHTPPDKILIQRLWAGKKPVVAWVMKNSGTREDAEDVLQDAIVACLKIIENPDTVMTVRPETLLFAVARKMWLNELRKMKRMPLSHLEAEDTGAIAGEDIDRLIEREQQLKQLGQALSDMGEKCRQLLQMFYFGHADMKQIAEKLGFRNDKVAKAMKYKCLEQVRQLIRKNLHEGY